MNALTARFQILPAARLKRRAKLHLFERALGKLPQVELKVEHHFAPGVYMRSMFIPAGVAVVGHIHKHACITIIQYGEVILATEHGSRRLVGPCTFETPAGAKRAGWHLKNTLLTTVHANPTDERDIDRLEDFLIAKSYDDVQLPSPNMGMIGKDDAPAP